MKSFLRLICGLIIVCCTSAALAGGPDVPPPPMAYDGFYVGLGGSYNSLAVHHQDNLLTGVPFQDYTSNLNKLAPIFQLGYWGMISDDFMFGFKAFYKYLNARPHLVYNNGGTSIFTLDHEIDHEVSFLVLFGVQVHDVLLYLGGGFVVFPSTQLRLHHVADAGAFRTDCETFWGGIAQIGVNYYFNPWWFMDASYTYAQASSRSFVTPLGTADSLDTRYGIVNQEFIFTINRRF